MDAVLILIDSDAELARARALVDRLWDSNDPADVARLEAQARLIAAYEERHPLAAGWRSRLPLHQLHPLAVHAAGHGRHYGRALTDAARQTLALA